jgi:selenocysteine lyase/cysteine desulfurase
VKTFTPSTASASENIERIAALITPNTRALSISHVTCATGQVLPVKEIG